MLLCSMLTCVNSFLLDCASENSNENSIFFLKRPSNDKIFANWIRQTTEIKTSINYDIHIASSQVQAIHEGVGAWSSFGHRLTTAHISYSRLFLKQSFSMKISHCTEHTEKQHEGNYE